MLTAQASCTDTTTKLLQDASYIWLRQRLPSSRIWQSGDEVGPQGCVSVSLEHEQGRY